jgi:hypothetical protein
MKTKRLKLESFKSVVKRIIKEEMDNQMSISKMIYDYNEAAQEYNNPNTDTFTKEENRQKMHKSFQIVKDFLNEKANQTAKQINKFYQAVVDVKNLEENNIFLRFYFGKTNQVGMGFSPGYRSFILDLKLVNGKKEINFEREESRFNSSEMSENYMQTLKSFANDIFDNVSSNYGSNIAQLEEEYKAYKNLSTFQLQAYVIELNKEIQAHKSRGDNKNLKLAMDDLAEVKAELASRKKGK